MAAFTGPGRDRDVAEMLAEEPKAGLLAVKLYLDGLETDAAGVASVAEQLARNGGVNLFAVINDNPEIVQEIWGEQYEFSDQAVQALDEIAE